MNHDFKIIELAAQPGLAIRVTVVHADIPAKMQEFFGELCGFMKSRNIEFAGPPFASLDLPFMGVSLAGWTRFPARWAWKS